jgi:hypothetical protein
MLEQKQKKSLDSDALPKKLSYALQTCLIGASNVLWLVLISFPSRIRVCDHMAPCMMMKECPTTRNIRNAGFADSKNAWLVHILV